MCYSWDSTLVYFLSSLLPAHLLIFPSQAKSLSSQHPRKPSTTILIKHLAVERPIFVFTNVTNPMEPHFFLPTNQIRALVWFIRGQVAHKKVFCLSWTEAGSKLIFCSVHSLVEPKSLGKKMQHLLCVCEILLVGDWFYYNELSNGNHVECCGTSFSHRPFV